MPVRWLRLASLLFLMIPAASSSEVVKLRDQSVVRGRLVSVDGDTLVFKSTFGTLRFHRQQVISIVFDDSAESVALVPAPTTTTPTNAAPAGRGRIEVVFKDRQLLFAHTNNDLMLSVERRSAGSDENGKSSRLGSLASGILQKW